MDIVTDTRDGNGMLLQYAVTKNANIKVAGRGNKKCEHQSRGNKNTNFKVGVTHAKQSQRRKRGASLDGGDRRVDLERFSDRDATL
jgi:hypothetical protein